MKLLTPMFEVWMHRLNMELDLQSLFGLHGHSCTHWLRPRNPPPLSPHIWAHIRGRYWSAKIDDMSLGPPVWMGSKVYADRMVRWSITHTTD
jgi:hypothetical protein